MRDFESAARKNGFSLIVGIDEAGRGPLAGPVVASAVILKKKKFHNRIADSKQLTPIQREEAFHEILDNSHVGIGMANEGVIDATNILRATHFAMAGAVRDLLRRMARGQNSSPRAEVFLLVDGNSFASDLPFAYQTIVRGDERCRSIACASIVAKVTRDRILRAYDRVFPQWGFKQHKGYPTESHRERIRQHGLSLIHRRTFQQL